MVIVVNFPGGLGSFRRQVAFFFSFSFLFLHTYILYNITIIYIIRIYTTVGIIHTYYFSSVCFFVRGIAVFLPAENRTYLWKYSLPAFSITLIISLYSNIPNSNSNNNNNIVSRLTSGVNDDDHRDHSISHVYYLNIV